jgi:hypothetical protein
LGTKYEKAGSSQAPTFAKKDRGILAIYIEVPYHTELPKQGSVAMRLLKYWNDTIARDFYETGTLRAIVCFDCSV